MRRQVKKAVILLGVCGVLAGCPDQGGVPGTREVDVTGKSSQEAAELVADAVCQWTAQCGVVWVECTSDRNGNTECSTGIEPVDYQQCVSEVGAEVRSDFECVEITPENARILNTCMNWMVNRDCYTPQDLQAIEEAEESDEPWPGYEDMPAECEEMFGLFEECAVSVEPEPLPGER